MINYEDSMQEMGDYMHEKVNERISMNEKILEALAHSVKVAHENLSQLYMKSSLEGEREGVKKSYPYPSTHRKPHSSSSMSIELTHSSFF